MCQEGQVWGEKLRPRQDPLEHGSRLVLYFRKTVRTSWRNLRSDSSHEFTLMRSPERIGGRPCDTEVEVELSCGVDGWDIY
jgi:hypothetical protein